MNDKAKGRRMQPNPVYFRRAKVETTWTGQDDETWNRCLVLASPEWHELCRRFDETFQGSLLRALAAAGVGLYVWRRLFRDANHGRYPFNDLGWRHVCGDLEQPFDYCMEVLGGRRSFPMHYPPIYPHWIVPYGLTQWEYLCDLEQYWLNVHPDYYRPWPATGRLSAQEIFTIIRNAEETMAQLRGVTTDSTHIDTIQEEA